MKSKTGGMSRTSRVPVYALLAVLGGLVPAGCTWSAIAPTDYFKDQTAPLSVAGFSVVTGTLPSWTEGPEIEIPRRVSAEIELTLDNPRNLDFRLTAAASPPGRRDNVTLRKKGLNKALIALDSPALGDWYYLTLEIESPDGLRVLEPYRLPPIHCTSDDTRIRSFPGTLTDSPPPSGAAGNHYDLWVPWGPPMTAYPLSVIVAPSSTYAPLVADFTRGPVTVTVTAHNGDTEDYSVSLRAAQASLASGTTVRHYTSFGAAVDAAAGTPQDPDTISVLASFTSSAPLNLGGKHITLTVPRSVSSTITVDAPPGNSFITVPSGASLILAGNGTGVLTLDGGALSAVPVDFGGHSLIHVSGGALFLGGGAALNNVLRSTGEGAGIFVQNNGTVTMTGGSITGMVARSGGAVYIAGTGGTVTMSGGRIHDNRAENGGGVYLAGGTFTMTGGAIHGNRAESSGGGVYVGSTGAFFLNSPAAISDIAGNQAIMSLGQQVSVNGNGVFRVNTIDTASY
ncbi:MAG: right-handed parallel beta-helix repeat-containing protein [Treponema sp.]|jgi:hypothetical protein|nr:right-handed parallel beta-helix repeat-containing protein [Treponema sp.]